MVKKASKSYESKMVHCDACGKDFDLSQVAFVSDAVRLPYTDGVVDALYFRCPFCCEFYVMAAESENIKESKKRLAKLYKAEKELAGVMVECNDPDVYEDLQKRADAMRDSIEKKRDALRCDIEALKERVKRKLINDRYESKKKRMEEEESEGQKKAF